MKFYIADLHFGDQRVYDKCWKYNIFNGLQDYESRLVKNWNGVVSDEDDIYVLGDIAEDHYDSVIDIMQSLSGKKHLIVGNHDLQLLPKYLESSLFQTIADNMLIDDNERVIHLSHYPIMDWMEYNRGGYLIYGHIHNKHLPQIKEYYKDKPAFNAGCDVTGYTPRTLDELIALKEKNKNEPFIN